MDFIAKHKAIVSFIFGGFDFSISNFSLTILCVPFIFFILSYLSLRKLTYYPGVLQNLFEMGYEGLYDFFYSYLGQKGKKYINFLISMMLFILILNFFSLIPETFPTTSQPGVTLTLSFTIFILLICIGFYERGWRFYKVFIPSGLPTILKPILFGLELVSFCIRPVSLAARLIINMFAGHMLLHIFASFAQGIGSGIFVTMILILIMIFKIGVSVLQAYIFSLLTVIYIAQLLEDH